MASEGLKRGRFIVPEEVAQIILLGIEMNERQPGHVLRITPDPLDWLQLGAIQGQEEQTYVLRDG